MVCGEVFFPLLLDFSRKIASLLRCVVCEGWEGGGALHVSCILFEISCISWSRVVHDVCHWLVVSWSLSNICVSSFICSVFSS